MNRQLMRSYLFLPLLCVALAAFVPAASAATVNLKDFGAVGDGQTDDGPALQQALDALANAGGGTLIVPQGRYAIITPVHKDFSGLASSITILGVESSSLVDNSGDAGVLASGIDLVSEFAPMTGATGAALRVSGLQHFLIKDIGFIGTPGVTTDAAITLGLDQVEDAIIRHCEFYGLISQPTGGAIVHANRSRLSIESTKFLGCTGNSSVNVPVVQNLRWKRINVTNSTFLDYGNRPELYGKTGMGTPYAWVNVGNAEAITNDSLRREVVLNDVFFDEGALVGLLATPLSFQPASAPIDLVYITGLRMNVNNASDWWGNYVWKANAVFIEKSRYQWSQHADAAVNLYTVGTAILDQLECVDSANRIRADATTNRLSVINSTYTYLDSLAQTTEVINTDSPAEDPVQYVRQQFETVLQRAPDPAGHFYWSDRILRCGADASCVAAARADLETYLNSAPAPTFSIAGRVTDPDGDPMTAQTVSLSGSQTVAAQTDPDGRYHFSDLPTSGVYTVTTSRDHFTFVEPSVTITTPTGDQTADFAAVLNKYSISGQIVDGNNEAMPNITVTLAGAMSAATTTNSEGYFAFEDVPALGGYTVTPSHKHHNFQPSSWTITALTDEYSGEILGIRKTHAIQGRVSRSNGAAIAGVMVNLSGSDTAATTTNSTGNYVFGVVPAGGNYVITAAKPNYSFTPQNQVVNDLSANESANFTGALVNYTLSGRIISAGTALGGVTVNLSGSQSGALSTDASGNYSFNATAEGNYTVTPSKKHYSFSPASISLNNLGANTTTDFSATLGRHRIGGRVTKADGTRISGVTVTLSGSHAATASTDANGDYSFATLPAGGNYLIVVSKQNYSFTPQSKTVNDLSADESSNFTGALVTYALSGRITAAAEGLSGVTVNLSGSTTSVTTTGGSGNYSFNVTAEGNYTVTPSRTHYSFAPASMSLNNLSANGTIDFSATRNQHAITGRVIKADGTGIVGATLALSGSQTATATTNTNGDYSFSGLPAGGTYTVAVSRAHYTFALPSSTWANLGANKVANFAGQLVSYEIEGVVTLSGVALPGVTLTVNGSQSTSMKADTDGSYSIMLPAEGSYIITPTRANYTFSPSSLNISNLSADSDIAFAATINPGVPVLISEATSTRALAFDAVLHLREPFRLNYAYPWSSDRRTRLMIFAQNFGLAPNETAAAITATAEASHHRSYPLTVEYVGKVPGSEWLTCIVVRLWDGMDDVGDVLVSITYRNIASNRVRIGIGHTGGGPADDPYAIATPGRAPQ